LNYPEYCESQHSGSLGESRNNARDRIREFWRIPNIEQAKPVFGILGESRILRRPMIGNSGESRILRKLVFGIPGESRKLGKPVFGILGEFRRLREPLFEILGEF